MTPNIHFEKVASGAAGRYVARSAGTDGVAEIIFTIQGPALISAEHTHAPESMRGTGVAAALVKHMISDGPTASRSFRFVRMCRRSTSAIRSGQTSGRLWPAATSAIKSSAIGSAAGMCLRP
jgi:predicted GNAT family acetyltransferase